MQVPTSVNKLIEKSGNNFHARVARWFQSNNWHTVVSPYYMDQTQSKAREIDLVVERVWPISNYGNQRTGDVVVRLFVECKYVASDSVFWLAPKDIESATALVCGVGGFRENNVYTNKHHYLREDAPVAKLFASDNVRQPENEFVFKALNQVLNATVAMRSRALMHPALQRPHRGKCVVMDFPVVICSSFAQMYAVNFLEESEPTRIDKNFQMEVDYAYLDSSGVQRNDYFLLDFVEFDQLTTFETALQTDAEVAAFFAAER